MTRRPLMTSPPPISRPPSRPRSNPFRRSRERRPTTYGSCSTTRRPRLLRTKCQCSNAQTSRGSVNPSIGPIRPPTETGRRTSKRTNARLVRSRSGIKPSMSSGTIPRCPTRSRRSTQTRLPHPLCGLPRPWTVRSTRRSRGPKDSPPPNPAPRVAPTAMRSSNTESATVPKAPQRARRHRLRGPV